MAVECDNVDVITCGVLTPAANGFSGLIVHEKTHLIHLVKLILEAADIIYFNCCLCQTVRLSPRRNRVLLFYHLWPRPQHRPHVQLSAANWCRSSCITLDRPRSYFRVPLTRRAATNILNVLQLVNNTRRRRGNTGAVHGPLCQLYSNIEIWRSHSALSLR